MITPAPTVGDVRQRAAPRTTAPEGPARHRWPRSPRSARRRSCWSAWSSRWPRSCWPSSTVPSVEAVTWEIARLDRIDPAEQAAVLEEFLGLGLRRLCFVFEDLLRMDDREIRAGLSRRGRRHLGAGPRRRGRRRCGPRSWGPSTAPRPPALRRSLESLGPFRLSDAEGGPGRDRRTVPASLRPGRDQPARPQGREEVLV